MGITNSLRSIQSHLEKNFVNLVIGSNELCPSMVILLRVSFDGFGTTKCGSSGDGLGSLGLGYCHLSVILLKQKLQQGNDYVSY